MKLIKLEKKLAAAVEALKHVIEAEEMQKSGSYLKALKAWNNAVELTEKALAEIGGEDEQMSKL